MYRLDSKELERIVKDAEKELGLEFFREAVEAEKVKIRKRDLAPWWHKIIPFTIVIRRR